MGAYIGLVAKLNSQKFFPQDSQEFDKFFFDKFKYLTGAKLILKHPVARVVQSTKTSLR